MQVFVTRKLPEEALEIVREVADTEVWLNEMPPSWHYIREKVGYVDGLLCLLTDRIDRELIRSARNLKVISQMAVGYDNIDIKACATAGILVGNTPGVLTETTADLAFALLLATARRVVEADTFLREGKWQTWSPMELTGPDVHHAVLGIVGMGRIGFEMARRARGFQMRLLYTSPHRNEAAERDFDAEFVPLPRLLAESDFVSLHAPLNESTRNLFDQNAFEQMKRSAIFINTSRGGQVDQTALVEALSTRRIAGAGLDVFETEPLPRNDPLLKLHNVVLLPHIGSASVATRTKMAVLAAQNLVAGLQGRPLPHPVTWKG